MMRILNLNKSHWIRAYSTKTDEFTLFIEPSLEKWLFENKIKYNVSYGPDEKNNNIHVAKIEFFDDESAILFKMNWF